MNKAGQASRLSKVEFTNAVAPETFVERRNCYGGPVLEALLPALDRYRDRQIHLTTAAGTRKEHYTAAEAALNVAFAQLLET